MLNQRKLQYSLLIGGVTIAAIILGMSLSDLTFQAGRPFLFHFFDNYYDVGGGYGYEVGRGAWEIIILFLMVLIAPFGAILIIRDKEARKKFFQQLRTVTAIVIITYLFLRRGSNLLEGLQVIFQSNHVAPESEATLTTPDAFITDPPDWLAFVTAVLVVIVIGLLIYYVWKRFTNRTEQIDVFAEQASLALQDIQSGRELHDVILQCYQRMSNVVRETRGINRAISMTPREFVGYLTSAGLPEASVKELTLLFEEARYSPTAMSEGSEERAVTCLNEIVKSVREQAHA